MAYFDQITSDSGTIVIIFNLMITNQITGGSDLDIETDPNDIRVQGFQFNMSDRKYISIRNIYFLKFTI